MNKHPKMVVGGVVDDDFSVLVDPRASIGDEARRIVEIQGFDDVAVALHVVGKDVGFVIERVISTEDYESIDPNKFRYGGVMVLKNLALGKEI